MKNDINEIFSIYFKKSDLKKINKAKILIVGCGGLGSNVANILVRTGFKNFILVDFDKIELKNLNRQQYFPDEVGKEKVYITKKRLLKINPKAKITAINMMLDEKKLEKIIKKYKPTIIVEAVDKEWSKTMIFETSLKLKKEIVCASGLAGFGDVENIKVIRKEKYTIIGDLVSACGCCDERYIEKGCREKLINKKKCHMPLAPKLTAVAAMQADEVLRRVIRD